MLIVKDKNMNEIGILDNAYNKKVKRRVNELWVGSFCMPIDDPKNELCSHFNYIDMYGASGRYYGLYRIMPTETKRGDNEITYKCESVLSVLMDDIMDPPDTNGYVQFTNQSTRTVLEGLLSFQETERIVLGECDFERYFDYAYENENGILNAIFDVPTRFGEPYQFVLHTETFPWVLDLIRPSDDIVSEIRWGKDMVSFDEVSDNTSITNFLVMKGWGEGINQMSIADANDGKRYLKDDESIARWGKFSLIKVDRRFKDPASLKAFGEKLLNEYKDPKISFTCDSVDLSILSEYEHEQKLLNGVTRIIVEDKEYIARIIGEDIDIDKEYNVKYEIGNRVMAINDVQADLERDIDVTKGYTNGSANYLSANETENADTTHPVKFRIWVPDDVVNINFMELTYESDYFWAYTKGSEAGGYFQKSSEVQSKSTSNGGAHVESSKVQSESTEGGGSYQESSKVQSETSSQFLLGDSAFTLGPTVSDYATHWHRIPASRFDHTHNISVTIPGFSIPSHSHGFTITIPGFSIPSHSHDFNVTIPAIEIPEHSHQQIYGIYEHDAMPTALEIKVDGNIIPQSALQGENIDIVPYLAKDTNGKIQRGRWAEVTLRPVDELVRINATIVWGLFISGLKGVTL